MRPNSNQTFPHTNDPFHEGVAEGSGRRLSKSSSFFFSHATSCASTRMSPQPHLGMRIFTITTWRDGSG